MEDKIKSDLNYLVGNTPVLYDSVFEELKPHYPSLTKDEFMDIVLSENLLCPYKEGNPKMLCRKEMQNIPPDTNPFLKQMISSVKNQGL